MVAFGLIGIGKRKLAHRLVELATVAEIAADGPRVTGGLGVRPR